MELDIPQGVFSAYIFDLDGTLIDSMPSHEQAWALAIQSVGVSEPFDSDLFYSLAGAPTRDVALAFVRRYGLNLPCDELAARKEQMFSKLGPAAAPRLIEPVVQFARKVATDHPLAVASGGTRDAVLSSLTQTGLRDLFSVVVTADDVPPGRGKPEPDIFLLAAGLLHVRPGECLVFEDAIFGVEAAKRAGMQVVYVQNPRFVPSLKIG